MTSRRFGYYKKENTRDMLKQELTTKTASISFNYIQREREREIHEEHTEQLTKNKFLVF